ncbi:hypothetical protein KKG90_12770, partial [Candidatus Bipolaricaulota bacterium]|nr:hypothetical protein [Candidatus Bipolaricaulota bacterium]
KTPGMHEYVVQGITIYAMPQDQNGAESIAARIAASRVRVVQALESNASDDIGVIVYPSQAALKRKTLGFAGMLLLPDWFIGRNTRQNVLITSPAAPGPQHSSESVIQAAVHEYVHVLTDRQNKKLGYWIKEGIALYLAQQTPSLEAIRGASDLTYTEYAAPNAIQFANVGGYTLAYTLIEYLDATYGWSQVIALIVPEATTTSVLGKSDHALFDEWMAHVRTL